jgi:hypothetical protein
MAPPCPNDTQDNGSAAMPTARKIRIRSKEGAPVAAQFHRSVTVTEPQVKSPTMTLRGARERLSAECQVRPPTTASFEGCCEANGSLKGGIVHDFAGHSSSEDGHCLGRNA